MLVYNTKNYINFTNQIKSDIQISSLEPTTSKKLITLTEINKLFLKSLRYKLKHDY